MPKSGVTPGRAWLQVAGLDLSPRRFQAAAVSDGPDGQWAGGTFERSQARDRARLKEHFAKLAKDCLYQHDTPPTNIVGGYKFPNAPVIDLAPTTPAGATSIATKKPTPVRS
jgi:hypothetical protein